MGLVVQLLLLKALEHPQIPRGDQAAPLAVTDVLLVEAPNGSPVVVDAPIKLPTGTQLTPCTVHICDGLRAAVFRRSDIHKITS